MCDDTGAVGTESFNLSSRLVEITALDPGLTVSFHATQPDADVGINAIATPGSYISGTGQVWVRVVDGNGCYNTAPLSLEVKPLPVINNNLPAYGECETAPGESVFTLTDIDAQVTLGAAGLDVKYYETLASALSGGPNNIAGPYTSGSRTVYVRVESAATGCWAVTELDLVAIPLPQAGTPSPLVVCDDNTDGVALFNLTPAGVQAVNGQPGLVATYHETPESAQAGANAITTPSAYNSVSDVVYIRVSDVTGAGCFAVTQVSLTVNPLPQPVQIGAYVLCDDAVADGITLFDLTTRSSLITNNSAGQSVTYYASEADLQSGTAIASPASWANTVAGGQQVYFRVTNQFGCTATGSFAVQVNPLPVVNTAPGTYFACEEAPGQGLFDLPSRNAEITLGAAGYNVSYHGTLAAAQSGSGSLPSPYLSGPGTVYVRVADATTGCWTTTSLTLSVIPAPIAPSLAPLTVCDDNNDGVVPFNINLALSQISNALSNVTLTVHETPEDADFNTNPIPAALLGSYTNLNANGAAVPTVYIRVQSSQTSCFDVVALELIVRLSPVATEPEALEVCDTNGDGQGQFNLDSTRSEVLGSLSPLLYTVSYHGSEAAALADTAPITGLLNYTSPSATVYVRVEDNATGCFDVVPLELIVNPLPVANQPVPYTLCDVNSPGDEREAFDLTTKIGEITGGALGVVVTFHQSFAQADANTNAIANTTAYINQATVQTLFVRVTNTATGCYRIVLLDVRVEPLPVLDVIPPQDRTACDADGDGFAVFNLGDLEDELINNGVNLEVTFHETREDALAGINPIPNPDSYTNIIPFAQTIYVRVVNTVTGCFNVPDIDFTLIVTPAPQLPDLELDPIVVCDEDPANNQDQQTRVDLTVRGDDIAAIIGTGFTITYYTSEAAAAAGAPRIATPASYQGTDGQVIWVRIEDATGCYNLTSFELEIGRPL
ncbi:hypothetical protein CHU92_04515, partial [Flavobacterium cyanobacteriorum]